MSRVYAVPFAQIPEWLLDAPVSDRAIRLFLILQRYAGAEGRAFPFRATLAERMNCATATVERALADLVEVGAITKVPHFRSDGSQTANDYWLWPAMPDSDDPSKVSEAPLDPSSPVMTPLPTDEDPPSSPVRTPLITGEDPPPHQSGPPSPSVRTPLPTDDDPYRKESQRKESKRKENQRKGHTQLRDGEHFKPSEASVASIRKQLPNLDLDLETQKFINYYLARGRAMKDWDAAWRNWMLNVERRPAEGPPSQRVVREVKGGRIDV